jgi:hypothetical protein
MLPLLLRTEVPNERQLLSHGQAATILMQSGIVGMGFLKEKWTEAEVMNLPAGEHDFFDRKSARLLNDMTNFRAKFAKAQSALANSAGGHIIFGQEDDLSITGAPPMVKKTPMREWLEQTLPFLVSYPLESFRVHQVIRDAAGSVIPTGQELFVIDIGESRLAPHQASYPTDNPQYFYRQGGKSIAAPHHYLEALRNRLTSAVLEAKPTRVHASRCWPDGEDFVVVEIVLNFQVKNVSRVACYKWGIRVSVRGDDVIDEYIGSHAKFPALGGGRGIPIGDRTILPITAVEDVAFLGFRVKLRESLAKQVQVIWPRIILIYNPISENHISPENEATIESIPTDSPILDRMRTLLTQLGTDYTP